MTFVIAEIGVNWDGNLDLAKEMMTKAKEIGCNAVKFQAFNEKTLEDHPERSRLMKSAISKTNIESINSMAKKVGIEWFCTPMYPEVVDILNPYVNRFKIREKDGQSLLKNKVSALLEKVLKTNKEMIVSVVESPRTTKFFNYPNIKWLYCVPKYPCATSDLDFRNLKDYHGYSNHCPEIIAPLIAAILGSEIIEVHVTSDKSKNFFDNNVSFDYSALKELVRLIRYSEKIMK